jgi:hypothetical protein
MSRFGAVTALAVALVLGACSDASSPTTPSETPAPEEFTLVLDESPEAAAAEEEEAAVRAGGALPATAGKGKASVDPQVVSCVSNAWHQICVDIRSGRLRAARADAIVRTFRSRTNAQLRVNGVIIARSGRFGPNFVGDELFANYNALNYRVFRGDRLCHQFPGVTPQICATIR